MNEQTQANQPVQPERREMIRKAAKAAYMIPAILAIVKASERPAYAQTSGQPS
ncbi:MAG: hypothetical protein J0L64_18930 [Acidobacteria bacterium]|nr:hypothetical protein [Acidobacteriota bacterium]